MPFADAEKNRSYQRDYKRLQRAGGSQTPGQTGLPVEFRWQTAADVLALLDEQVAAGWGEAPIVRLSKAVGTSPHIFHVENFGGAAKSGIGRRVNLATANTGDLLTQLRRTQ